MTDKMRYTVRSEDLDAILAWLEQRGIRYRRSPVYIDLRSFTSRCHAMDITFNKSTPPKQITEFLLKWIR